LIVAGLPGDTPVALVENASLPTERHFHTRLDLLALAARAALGDGPALLLIGEVAGCGQGPGCAQGPAKVAPERSSRILPCVTGQ